MTEHPQLTRLFTKRNIHEKKHNLDPPGMWVCNLHPIYYEVGRVVIASVFAQKKKQPRQSHQGSGETTLISARAVAGPWRPQEVLNLSARLIREQAVQGFL